MATTLVQAQIDSTGQEDDDPDEDAYDAQVAKEAYQEYVDSGYQSRPFAELLKELDL